MFIIMSADSISNKRFQRDPQYAVVVGGAGASTVPRRVRRTVADDVFGGELIEIHSKRSLFVGGFAGISRGKR